MECFLCESRLRFSEIERGVGVRSNKLSYHLGKLVSEGILMKDSDEYILTEEGEKEIPYVSDKRFVMPVVLVAIERDGRVFLIDRKKRPFFSKLSLPAGRMIQGEGFEDAVKRIGKKFGVRCEFEKVCSVTLEHVTKVGSQKLGVGSRKLHSFLLILVKARTTSELEYVDIVGRKGEIIGSDYQLLREDLEKEIFVKSLETLD